MGLMTVFILALVISLGITCSEIYGLKSPSSDQVCLTKECTMAAAAMLEYADTSADPCENFFQYACGGFVDDNYVREGLHSVSQFAIVQEQNDKKLIKSIEDENSGKVEEDHHSMAFKEASAFYTDCMDTDELDGRGIQPIQDLLHIPDALVADIERNHENNATTRQEAIFKAIGELQRNQIRVFFDYYVNQDDRNSTEYLLHVSQGMLGLPDPCYFTLVNESSSENLQAGEAGDEQRQQMQRVLNLYKGIIQEGLQLLSSRSVAKTFSYVHSSDEALEEGKEEDSSENSDDNDDADRFIQFESQIAACHMPKEYFRIPLLTYNKMSLNMTGEIFPLDWRAFIEDISGRQIDGINMSINVETPASLECIKTVLQNASARDIGLYMRIYTMFSRAQLLGEEAREWHQKVKFLTTGQVESTVRWRHCLYLVNSPQNFRFALSKPFLETEFSAESKAQVQSIVDNIEEAFVETLPSIWWMEDTTKEQAREKAQLMEQLVGYPDWVMNDTKVNDFYNLSEPLESGKYFENSVVLLKAYQRRQFGKIFGENTDLEQWHLSPSEINAYYAPNTNTIVFPAGILKPPFYSPEASLPVNYGSLGVIVGHEFSHAFDSSGRKYDAYGNLKPWWTEKDDAHYKERETCYIDQYSSYELYGYPLDGNLTLPENMADNAGLQLAFRAFTKESEANRIQFLPSTPWSQNQLFYMGFAQPWCQSMREETALRNIITDPHTSPEFRVNGAVSNSKDFAKAFQCKLGSKMNPEKKCVLWS
jgi:predicted metalloendopeptidase